MQQYSENPIESAYSLYGSGAMQDALALCKKILRHQPKNFEATYLSGLAHCRMGDTKTGRRLIKRSNKIYPRIKAFGYKESVLRHQGVDDITIIKINFLFIILNQFF